MGAAGPEQQPDCVGVESRGSGAGPVPLVPNSSSLYTLFYSVIYNSVPVFHSQPLPGWRLNHV